LNPFVFIPLSRRGKDSSEASSQKGRQEDEIDNTGDDGDISTGRESRAEVKSIVLVKHGDD